MTLRTGSRAAAILLGLLAALMPMALLAFDTGLPPAQSTQVIAQATGTAAPKAATPAATAAPKAATATAAPKTATAVAPKTGGAGTLTGTSGAGMTVALVVVAFSIVIGARAVARRRA